MGRRGEGKDDEKEKKGREQKIDWELGRGDRLGEEKEGRGGRRGKGREEDRLEEKIGKEERKRNRI